MEVQRGEVVAICEVEREGGCPLAMVAGLPHCVDLGDGEVDGLPALRRREGLQGQGRGREGRRRREGRRKGRGGEGRGGGRRKRKGKEGGKREHMCRLTLDMPAVTPHSHITPSTCIIQQPSAKDILTLLAVGR